MRDILIGIQNQSFFDSRWSAIHFASGLIIGLAVIAVFAGQKRPLRGRTYGRLGIVLLILWEYFEVILRFLNTYHPPLARILKFIFPDSFFHAESTVNIISDLILGSIGLLIAYLYGKKRNRSIPASPSDDRIA